MKDVVNKALEEINRIAKRAETDAEKLPSGTGEDGEEPEEEEEEEEEEELPDFPDLETINEQLDANNGLCLLLKKTNMLRKRV
jgi:hypothetical protein